MRKTCSRCGAPTASWMAFDYPNKSVWLEDHTTESDVTRYSLCANHADRLTPPLGWVLSDRRTVTPLFAEGVA
ncbi:MAG: DUF3499 family protein [Acidimicrobiia bacterium]|nr:DUF3499 family protein [Acidimicrobiia bacterium]